MPRRGSTAWPPERVEQELRDWLAQFDAWPPRSVFDEHGKNALRRAMERTGGAQYWAPRLGLRRQSRREGPTGRADLTRNESALARARLEAGLSQRQLAESAQLSLSTVSRLERGQFGPEINFRALVNLAVVLDRPLRDLIEDDWLDAFPFHGQHAAGRARLV